MQPPEVVRRQYAAFTAGGLDAVERYWSDGIEWRAVAGAADDVGLMRGRDALRRYYADWAETLVDLRADVEAVVAEEDGGVAVAVRHWGRGRASGVPVEGLYFVACAVSDGRITAGREYGSRAEAIAGLRALLGG